MTSAYHGRSRGGPSPRATTRNVNHHVGIANRRTSNPRPKIEVQNRHRLRRGASPAPLRPADEDCVTREPPVIITNAAPVELIAPLVCLHPREELGLPMVQIDRIPMLPHCYFFNLARQALEKGLISVALFATCRRHRGGRRQARAPRLGTIVPLPPNRRPAWSAPQSDGCRSRRRRRRP